MERNIKIRDLRRKQFFMVDDEFLNGYVRYLGTTATAVYLVLCRHASREQVAFPSIKTIAEKLNFNEKTIRRKIKVLEKYRIIQVIRERDEKGRWKNNVYILLDKTEWLSPADTGVHTHTPTRVRIREHIKKEYIKNLKDTFPYKKAKEIIKEKMAASVKRPI